MRPQLSTMMFLQSASNSARIWLEMRMLTPAAASVRLCNRAVSISGESRKIMGLPELAVVTTAVRVPVLRAHSAAVFLEFERNDRHYEPVEERIRHSRTSLEGAFCAIPRWRHFTYFWTLVQALSPEKRTRG